jgi:hypothetical protein
MTDRLDPQRDNPTRPIGSVGDIEDQVAPGLGDDDRTGMPEHEIDENETIGGGILATGGTAIDRGTGGLAGQAQGTTDDDDDETVVRDAGVAPEDD